MIKYRTGGWGREKIEVIEVEKETAQSVYINGRRSPKISSYKCYFDSWKKAKDHLLEKAQKKVNAARSSLDYANGELGNIKGLKDKSILDQECGK